MTRHYSTASTKSTCITVALVALTSSHASASSAASVPPHNGVFEGHVFDSMSSIIKRARPVLHMPSMSASTDARTSGNENDPQGRNTSMYHYVDDNDDDVDDFELLDRLPRELAALIASASAGPSSPAAAPTIASVSTSRYHPTYTDGGESCSAKSSSKFNSWEVSYDTLHECCDKAFGWDYDACMTIDAAGL